MKNLFKIFRRGGGRLAAFSNGLIRSSNTFASGQTVHFGFTLAEVLVTLGIIGVVSALTMPTLISNHQEKVRITMLQTVYSQLSQATLRMVDDKGGGLDNIWGEYPMQTYVELLPKYINITEKEFKAHSIKYLNNSKVGE